MFNVLHAPFNAVHEPIGLGVAGRQQEETLMMTFPHSPIVQKFNFHVNFAFRI